MPVEKRRMASAIMIAVLLGALVVTYNVLAFSGGTGDQDTESTSCDSCHGSANTTGLAVSATSYRVGQGRPKIFFRLTLDLGSQVSTPTTVGLGIFTEDGKHPEDAGWQFLRDPNNNPVPKNYNEVTYQGARDFVWEITNDEGEYTLTAVVYFGNSTGPFRMERTAQVNVLSPDYNYPPRLENATVSALSEDTTLFEVTYSDPEGLPPTGLWVNISSLGAYSMTLKAGNDQNWTGGADFYHIAGLEPGKYSYHISAYDGKNWTVTENEIFYVQKDGVSVDYTALVVALVAGIAVAAAAVAIRWR